VLAVRSSDRAFAASSRPKHLTWKNRAGLVPGRGARAIDAACRGDVAASLHECNKPAANGLVEGRRLHGAPESVDGEYSAETASPIAQQSRWSRSTTQRRAGEEYGAACTMGGVRAAGRRGETDVFADSFDSSTVPDRGCPECRPYRPVRRGARSRRGRPDSPRKSNRRRPRPTEVIVCGYSDVLSGRQIVGCEQRLGRFSSSSCKVSAIGESAISS